MEVCNIIEEAVTKAILMKRKWKKAKGLSEDALQMAEKTRETKGKGERERYTHLKAEFQSTARRDEEAFLSEEYKKIEEINIMGKTNDLFMEIPALVNCHFDDSHSDRCDVISHCDFDSFF